MEKNRFPYLCGGTFFVLLLQARKQRRKARNKLDGGNDGLSNPDVLNGLIKIVTGSCTSIHPSSLKTATSEYKECKSAASNYLPFNDRTRISSFNRLMEKDYPVLINRMNEFLESFIDQFLEEQLVRSIIEVIKDDADIAPDAEFFITDGEHATTKKELITMNSFLIQPFLLGVIHFILNNRENNTLGRHTIETWGPKPEGRAERKFNDYPFGESLTHDISVSRYVPEIKTDESAENVKPSSSDILKEKILASGQAVADTWKKAMDALADEVQDASPDPEEETVEAEIVDDDTIYQESERKATTNITNIAHQTTVIQNGETNINIGHVENLKL